MTQLATGFGDADESTGLLLWRVSNAWQAAQRAALKPFGLTHVQFVLLASTVWLQRDEPLTQQHVAEHAGTDPMMTSQVMRTLERNGLVERHAHPTDRRAKQLVATKAGRELANRAVLAVEACDADYFSRLRTGIAPFTRMLQRLSA